MLYLHFSHWLNIAPQGIISLHLLLVIVSLGSSGQWQSNIALYLGPEVMSTARAVFSHNPKISWHKQSIRRQKREAGIRVQPRESSGHRLEHRQNCGPWCRSSCSCSSDWVQEVWCICPNLLPTCCLRSHCPATALTSWQYPPCR